MEIRKLLVLSTSHLPEGYFNSDLEWEPAVFWTTQYGGLLWVPDEPGLPENTTAVGSDGIPYKHIDEDILKIQVMARQLGCDYVLFDSDGPVEPGLKQYDWGYEPAPHDHATRTGMYDHDDVN